MKKYLPLYKKWSVTGQLPKDNGLCNQFSMYNWRTGQYEEELLFSLIRPTRTTKAYWGFEGLSTDPSACGKFGPLRQNLVLLMAAMNDEL